MGRITHFLVMMFVVMVVIKAEGSTFKCEDGAERKQASALCDGFVTNVREPQPSSKCCTAYRAFVETAKTKEERRQLCECAQRRARAAPVNITNFDALLPRCGLHIRFSVDPNFDCNTVN